MTRAVNLSLLPGGEIRVNATLRICYIVLGIVSGRKKAVVARLGRICDIQMSTNSGEYFTRERRTREAG